MFPGFPDQFRLALINYDISPNIPVEKIAAFQLHLINGIKLCDENIFIHYIMDKNAIILLLPVHHAGLYSKHSINWHEQLESIKGDFYDDMDYSVYFSLSDIYNKPTELTKACAILDECIAILPKNLNYYIPALVYNILHDIISLLKLEDPILLKDITIPRHEMENEEDLFKKTIP